MSQTLKGLRGMDGKQWQREMERRGGQEQQREERGEENRSNANIRVKELVRRGELA